MTPSFIQWLATDARRVLLAEVEVRIGSVETTRYLSTSGYVTGASDSPANTVYSGRLTGGFSFNRSLDISGEGGGVSYGELELDNTDGALDAWLDDVWAMRAINLYLGAPEWNRSQFELILSGTVEDIGVSGRGALSLRLRDILAPLDKPISTMTVGGTGSNKDTVIPVALGEVCNVEPVLTSTSGLQTYKVHIGAVEQIIEVRDNGYPITVTKDEANGTFTLNYQRWGQITCDVQGAKIGTAYRNDVGGLIEWVATTIGDGDKLAASQIDTTHLASFRTAHPQPVGLWASGTDSRIGVMQQLAAAIGATVTAIPSGKLRVVQLEFSTPVRTIGPDQMVEDSFQPVVKPSVKGAVKLIGCKNWTPQDKSKLAADLQANQLTLLSEETTPKTESDATVLANYRQTDEPEETESLLVVEADLAYEAARRLALWKLPRKVFRFEGYAELMDLELGDTITLVHSRFGLQGGANAIIVGLDTDYIAARVIVEVMVGEIAPFVPPVPEPEPTISVNVSFIEFEVGSGSPTPSAPQVNVSHLVFEVA